MDKIIAQRGWDIAIFQQSCDKRFCPNLLTFDYLLQFNDGVEHNFVTPFSFSNM